MKKNMVRILLITAVAIGALAGCGNQGGSDVATGSDTQSNSDAQGSVAADVEEGKVINIYSFNEELRNRITAVYPEIVSTSNDKTESTLKDGTVIHWIINPNQDGVYQQKLDEALMNQADADADIDAAMTLESLGINPDTDLTDQFDFTRAVACDQLGVQRASTWQACPGVLVYRRDIANEVFGTDDPEEIGKLTKDWATMKDTAEQLKASGYYTFSSYADTFRLYNNSMTEAWVATGETTIKVDQKIMD